MRCQFWARWPRRSVPYPADVVHLNFNTGRSKILLVKGSFSILLLVLCRPFLLIVCVLVGKQFSPFCSDWTAASLLPGSAEGAVQARLQSSK